MEEEGEIFRKGAVLLGPEEMEGEYAGEDLRREVRPVPVPLACPSLTFPPTHSFSKRWSNARPREASSTTLVG